MSSSQTAPPDSVVGLHIQKKKNRRRPSKTSRIVVTQMALPIQVHGGTHAPAVMHNSGRPLSTPTFVSAANVKQGSPPCGGRLTESEAEYLDSIADSEARRLATIERGLSNKSQGVPLRFRILSSNLPDSVKMQMLQRLKSCNGMDHKYETWMTRSLEIPIGITCPVPQCDVASFLSDAHAKMEQRICGNMEAKFEVLRILAQWLASGDTSACVIGFCGPPGVGKTTFARTAIAETLNRPFSFISLAGANDSSFLNGHSYTYEGSMPGRIVEEIIDTKCTDPVLYFDELVRAARGYPRTTRPPPPSLSPRPHPIPLSPPPSHESLLPVLTFVFASSPSALLAGQDCKDGARRRDCAHVDGID